MILNRIKDMTEQKCYKTIKKNYFTFTVIQLVVKIKFITFYNKLLFLSLSELV